NSTLGSATVNNNAGATIGFFNATKGGSATINNNGNIQFADTSTAENATINNDALIQFFTESTGGNAVINNTSPAAVVDFSASTGPANNGMLSVGSLEGSGNFYLGANVLMVGSNNLSTTVSGVISDCGASGMACNRPGATGGSLVKVGSGVLTLSG